MSNVVGTPNFGPTAVIGPIADILDDLIVNADINSAAAIALSKLAAATANRALVSDASGFISAATTTSTEIGYVNGVTSAIQTQLNAKSSNLLFPIPFSIDGQGFTITTGVKGPTRICPFAGTITGWYIVGDQSGSIVFDVWKQAFATGSIPTVANTITASAKPTLTTTFAASSTTLTGWTTSITAGDQILINVDSVTTLTQAILVLVVTKTS